MKNESSATVEQLENDDWGDPPEESSYVVRTCHKLRRKKMSDLEIEDLRLLIGQNIGLKYLIPVAMDILRKDTFAEGDFYPGDLLNSVLRSDKKFWQNEEKLKEQVLEMLPAIEVSIDEFKPTSQMSRDLKTLANDFKEN